MPNRTLLGYALELLDGLITRPLPPQPCTPSIYLNTEPHSIKNPHNMPLRLHHTLLHYRLLLLSHSKDKIISRMLKASIQTNWSLTHSGDAAADPKYVESMLQTEQGRQEILQVVLDVLAHVVADEKAEVKEAQADISDKLTLGGVSSSDTDESVDSDNDSLHSEDINWADKTSQYFDSNETQSGHVEDITLDTVRKSFQKKLVL